MFVGSQILTARYDGDITSQSGDRFDDSSGDHRDGVRSHAATAYKAARHKITRQVITRSRVRDYI